MLAFYTCNLTRWIERSAATQETHKYDNKKQKKIEEKHNHNDPVASLDFAHAHKSVIYVTTQSAKRTHQQVIPQQAPKTQKVDLTHPKKQCVF